MRDDRESGWLSRWEEELPSPEELTPLSQSLISPNLALAFDIPSPQSQIPPQSAANSSAEFDSGGSGGGGGAEEPARTLKRPRLVWTPQLHKRFVDAVAHLGIKNAVPKTIMQLMSVDGLTRENVASHLQKYRLYLKRMQGIPSGGGGGGGAGHGPAVVSDPATDHLFASSPVPPHFLRPSSDHFLPFVAAPAAHHPMAVVPPPPPQLQHHHHHFRQFGSAANGQFEHPFVRQSPQGMQRMGAAASMHGGNNGNGSLAMPPSYVEDFESGGSANGRKILTLFPTGED